MTSVQDALTEWAFTAGWSIVRRLPEPAAARLFELAADRTWRKQGRSVLQLQRNLARVCPDLGPEAIRELSREGMRRYMRYYLEAFRLPAWSPDRISRDVRMRDVEVLDAPVRDGRGVVTVGAHMGNWDLAGAWGAVRYGAVTTVAERLKPEGVYQRFLAFRESLGIQVIPTGDAGIVSRLVRVAKDGGVVAIVGDRDLSGNGVDVEFFGETAPFPVGPAVISLLSGAPLVVAATWHEDDHLAGQCIPIEPADPALPRDEQIAILTQRIADALSGLIAEHPADWHMLQRLWPSDTRADA